MADWEYGGAYKRHDMSGRIEIGGGIVQVHDLFEDIPDFMLSADCVFVDPPCSLGNLNSFYTKAGLNPYHTQYELFLYRLFLAIDAIAPRWLFVEAFRSNLKAVVDECARRYPFVAVDESTYYHQKRNHCWIVRCAKTGELPNPRVETGKMLDEADYIAWVCKLLDFECIGDPCMGRGLVGWNAFLNGKQFVGTELNPKRLAVLVEKITNALKKR